jgi:hypothetical protein
VKHAQTLRIAALLAVIFAAGLVTGRLTAPRPPALIRTADGRIVASDQALDRLTRYVRLSADQEPAFRKLVEEIAGVMAKLPPASQARFDVFNQNLPRMKALLRPDQMADFDRYVRDTESRWQEQIRRHSKTE